MINQQIGSTIADLRRKRGLTQEQLAEKLGVTNRSISRWENGVTAPDISMLQDLSEYLGVPISQLITQKFQKMPNDIQKKAFSRISEELVSGEYVQFAFIAESCAYESGPGPWHITAVITDRRILLCGETIRGRMMTQLVTDDFPRKALTKYKPAGNALFLRFPDQVIRLQGPSMDAVYRELAKIVP